MNDTEKQIAASILKKIVDTGSGDEIQNYLRFLEAVRHRIAIEKEVRG